MRLTVFLGALVWAAPAVAEPHKMALTYSDQLCGEVVQLIDAPAPSFEGAGTMALAFGYLLGFEAANGGDLSGDQETVLKRFRSACAESPSLTGLELL